MLTDEKTPLQAVGRLRIPSLVSPETGRLSTPVQAMLVYGAVRFIAIATTASLLHHGRFREIHHSLWTWMAHGFDGNWYEGIAAHGYPHVYMYNWFPGYPAAMDAIAWIPGIGVNGAGPIVTIIAGLVAAAGLARLGVTLTGDRRTGLLMVALWAVAPGSIVLMMTYAEALFCALAVWALVALTERRWVSAGILTMAAGTVRSTAIALVAVVAVAALAALGQSARTRSWTAGSWRQVIAVLLAPLGLVAFWAFVAVRSRLPGGWLSTEKNVGMSVDWGASLLRTAHTAFMNYASPFVMLTLLAIAAAMVLTAWSLTERIPAYLHVYTLVVVGLAVLTSAHYLGSKPRFLLPAFLLTLPLAGMLARVRLFVLIPLIAILAVASTWFGLFLASLGWAP
jgi:hypothetical protein